MRKAVIIKTGDTFGDIASRMGDFEDWILAGLKWDMENIRVVDVTRGGSLPSPSTITGAVVAGSHAMVTQDLDWSLKVEKWLPTVVHHDIPVLGICYGHQLLARAMGGLVGYLPGGLDIGTTTIPCPKTAVPDLLFGDVPEKFKAHVCHSQTVLELPKGAVLLAKNDVEPHHAFRIGPSAWGVQFHPEYDETIMEAYTVNMQKQIKASGQDPAAVLSNIKPTPLAAAILERFGEIIRDY